MKLTIDLGTEIEPAIQKHLADGYSVQDYFRRALELFNYLDEKVRLGPRKIGIARERNYNYGYSDNYEEINIWVAGKPPAPSAEEFVDEVCMPDPPF